MDYPLPGAVRVEADGPVRIVRLSRPEQLNAVNEDLHLGLTRVFPLLTADADARVAVITGEGRAFSAGGDFDLLQRMVDDRRLRRDVIAEARELVVNMIRCRIPLVAAVNGPAVGLGCSLALSCDVVLISDRAHLADPHVNVGLVAGDGGAALWPLFTSLLRAKEYIFTGDRIAPDVAVQIGLANRVVPAAELMDAAEPGDDLVAEVIRLVEASGGLEAARQRALELAQQAEAELDVLPASPARDALQGSIAYAVERRS